MCFLSFLLLSLVFFCFLLFLPFGRPPGGPRGSQELPLRLPRNPKGTPRVPKSTPRGFQKVPGPHHKGARVPQEDPRHFLQPQSCQGGPKTFPRAPQEAPKRHPGHPKRAQEDPKRKPRGVQGTPRAPQARQNRTRKDKGTQETTRTRDKKQKEGKESLREDLKTKGEMQGQSPPYHHRLHFTQREMVPPPP